jgi:thioredoxin-like negative regulator of GroEL
MQRVAGSNFRQYVLNESADVCVLFEKAKCRPCMQAYDQYRKFAAAVLANGTVKYELNHMTMNGNRIEGGFPVATVPAIVLWPANNKSGVRVCPGETFDVIAWFTQRYASEKHNIPFKLPDEEAMAKIEGRARELAEAATPELRERLKETLEDLRNDVAQHKQDL